MIPGDSDAKTRIGDSFLGRFPYPYTGVSKMLKYKGSWLR